MLIICYNCGVGAHKPTSHVKRSRDAGLKVFCDTSCGSEWKRGLPAQSDRFWGRVDSSAGPDASWSLTSKPDCANT